MKGICPGSYRMVQRRPDGFLIHGILFRRYTILKSIEKSLRIISEYVLKISPTTKAKEVQQLISEVHPIEGINVEKVREKIKKAGLKPQEAKYWKELP